MKPKTRKKRRAYPPTHRAKQAENCRRHAPWKQSTGPRSAAGKATVSQNARTHGYYSAEMAELRRVLRLQRTYLRAVLFDGTP